MAKNTAIQTTENNLDPELVSNLVLAGDLSKMTPEMKVDYYNRFCQSLGLNPLTQPFQLLIFQGKQRLYATKDCTEQLRKIHGVSITDVTAAELRGVYVVTAKALDKSGKTDAATGVVPVENLKGEALANALMKAETKAKRRVTLSICGLGILDESELDTMPNHKVTPVDAPSVTLVVDPTVEDAVKEMEACTSLDCCASTWKKYNHFQTSAKFQAAKDAKKQQLSPVPIAPPGLVEVTEEMKNELRRMVKDLKYEKGVAQVQILRIQKLSTEDEFESLKNEYLDLLADETA